MATVTNENALGGRIALLEPSELNHAQDKLYKRMLSEMVSWADKSGFQADTEDKRLIGPFNPMLLSPEISAASLDYLKAEQDNTTLTKRMREIVILATGAAFQSAYELYAHKAVAKSVGLEEDAITAISSGQAPTGLPVEEMAVYELTHALATMHKADSAVYSRAVEAIGTQGVVDLIHLSGNYMTISTLLNAFEVPAP